MFFEYNDEFLTEGGIEHQHAKEDYAPIFFALFNKRLFGKFDEIDKEAIQAKRRMMNRGILIILLGLIALLMAGFEITVLSPLSEIKYSCSGNCAMPEWTAYLGGAENVLKIKTWLAGVAAVFGMASFMLGVFEFGFGNRKRHWLLLRAKSESFRQWRWSYYLAHQAQIANAIGSKETIKAYIDGWEKAGLTWFKKVDRDMSNVLGGLLDEQTDMRTLDEFILVKARTDTVGHSITEEAHKATAKMMAEAYSEIRMSGQVNYIHHTIQKRGRFRTHPARQAKLLHTAEDYLVSAVMLLHVAVVLGVALGLPALKSKFVHLLAISGALITFAVLSIEKGLRPSVQLSRLRGYYSEIRRVQKSFSAAHSADRRLEIAQEFESAARSELYEFLYEGDSSRFVF